MPSVAISTTLLAVFLTISEVVTGVTSDEAALVVLSPLLAATRLMVMVPDEAGAVLVLLLSR